MQKFETPDSKVALHARSAQFVGANAMLTIEGSLVMGRVHSVVEVEASNPTRWIITLFQKRTSPVARNTCN
jgi:hypothetical protein